MSILSDIQQQASDTVASVGRQFDDTAGGGFADELGELADPTQRTSDETESDVRALFDTGMPSMLGTSLLLQTSDYLDREAGRDPPGDDPEHTVTTSDITEYYQQIFRGNTPGEQAAEEADRAGGFVLQQALDSPYITVAVLGLVALVLLYLLRPLLTIGANVSG